MFRLSSLLRASERRQKRVAKQSGLAETRIREIAEGAPPTTAEVIALSRVLKVPVSDLLGDAEPQSGTALRFREMASLPDGKRKQRAEAAVTELSSKIEGFSELLRAGGYTVNRSKLPAKIDTTNPAELAALFRQACFGGDFVSPLATLPKILDECLSIVVVVTRSAEVDGASAFIDGIPFALIKAQFQPRMLFTLAHELGHLLLHWDAGEFARIDPLASISRGTRRTEPEEMFANEFASEVLLPAAGVGVALATIREITNQRADHVGDIELLLLSRLFSVSFETAALRCERLNLIPAGGARALYRTLIDDHGTPEKRADSVGLPPRTALEFPAIPEVLLNAASEAVRSGQMSIGSAVDRLGVPYSSLMRPTGGSVH
jgi:Zn-dependent peptidase ImmA (M78 family)